MATFARPQTRPSPHEPGLSCRFEASFLGEDPSELLKRKECQGDQRHADHIKRVSPVSWKHVNFYGEYNFRETAEAINLSEIVDRLEAANGNGEADVA
jgi:hypothetical protein